MKISAPAPGKTPGSGSGNPGGISAMPEFLNSFWRRNDVQSCLLLRAPIVTAQNVHV